MAKCCASTLPVADWHRAEEAEERGEGICRTCLAPIWNEGGTIGHQRRETGWSDRIERGGDSLVCFKAVGYRHVPLTGREACIYDRAYQRGAEQADPAEMARKWSEACAERDRETCIRLDLERQLAAARDLIRRARLISPSDRAVIYVADLERALGIDAPVPHKLGGNR